MLYFSSCTYTPFFYTAPPTPRGVRASHTHTNHCTRVEDFLAQPPSLPKSPANGHPVLNTCWESAACCREVLMPPLLTTARTITSLNLRASCEDFTQLKALQSTVQTEVTRLLGSSVLTTASSERAKSCLSTAFPADAGEGGEGASRKADLGHSRLGGGCANPRTFPHPHAYPCPR